MDPRSKWDERYRQVASTLPKPAQVLSENSHLLPPSGRALDLACGLGGNAVWLAQLGLETEAWDISSVAIERLQTMADQQGLSLKGQVRDVVTRPPQPECFHVIVVTRFLERSLASDLMAALYPGGLLFYQTFTRLRVGEGGPSNPDFRLVDNELLELFSDLRLRVYREEGRLGDLSLGFRNEALLVAQKA